MVLYSLLVEISIEICHYCRCTIQSIFQHVSNYQVKVSFVFSSCMFVKFIFFIYVIFSSTTLTADREEYCNFVKNWFIDSKLHLHDTASSSNRFVVRSDEIMTKCDVIVHWNNTCQAIVCQMLPGWRKPLCYSINIPNTAR